MENYYFRIFFVSILINSTEGWLIGFTFNVNPINITPGTELMDYLMKYIDWYIRMMVTQSPEWENLCVIFSSDKVPGEGEHKIYKYIRDNVSMHKEYNTAIYGLDADLIMLSLNHLSYCKNIYLYREAPHFISNIDNTLSSNEEYIIDMDMFRGELYKLMVDGFEINKSRDQCIKDYIFICFILGNDFLPHFPAMNIRHSGVDQLLQLYKMLYGNNEKTLIKNNKICWKNLKTFIKHIGDNEEELLLNIYKIRNRLEKRDWPEDNLEEKLDKFMNNE